MKLVMKKLLLIPIVSILSGVAFADIDPADVSKAGLETYIQSYATLMDYSGAVAGAESMYCHDNGSNLALMRQALVQWGTGLLEDPELPGLQMDGEFERYYYVETPCDFEKTQERIQKFWDLHSKAMEFKLEYLSRE